MSYVVTMDKDMAMVPSLSITREEFCLFHSIDRAFYSLLVTNLMRDPVESMVVVALFLWLERKGFRNVVSNALAYPRVVVDELAKEAVEYLRRIKVISGEDRSVESSGKDDLPLMRKLVDKELTASFFCSAGEEARRGVCDVFGKVCVNALLDIMQAAIASSNGKAPEHPSARAKSSSDQHQLRVQERGFPGTLRFGSNDALGRIWLQQYEASSAVPAEDRTLFVTFSKGYPVQEWEVREFLTKAYGECIEALHMQEVPMFEQSLFARVVFRSAGTINRILDPSGKAKFVINGKHVWARKFIPKRNKINELPSHHSQVTLPPSFPLSM
ncbi:hypothetical protein MLD38_005853 [Melastoma candidum]|uniref:Uncharacterized protein n=1 Tax=Melastoma candidum TaxID=119954 RepID=A0ACB9RKR8_9MYRT|nr:hypothetical protein MLD38_005853 [Melastoma candidum]